MGQTDLNETEAEFLKHMSRLLEGLALMIVRMTSLINKYELVMENHKSVIATLDRIERKQDAYHKPEEGSI